MIDLGPNAMPDRIAIDAHGYGWRVWDDEDHWSMVPTNPDNGPIPQPVTWFVPAADDRQTQIRAVAAECSVVLYSGSSDCCVWCGNHGEADTDEFCPLASLLAALLAPAVSLPEEAEPPRMVVDEWGFPAFPAPAVSLELPEPPELLPAEKMALTVASAQVRRGDAVPPNTATMLVMALERLTASTEPPIEDAGSGGVR